MEMYITDRQDFKMKVVVSECSSPSYMRNIQFVREEYNDKNELINSNTSQFFLNDIELNTLSKILEN
jgi:hypothetical protein